VTVLSLRFDGLGSERKSSCVCKCNGMIRARDGEANEQSNSRSRRLADEKIFFFHPKISRSFEINNIF
jgi:hypothetical protein